MNEGNLIFVILALGLWILPALAKALRKQDSREPAREKPAGRPPPSDPAPRRARGAVPEDFSEMFREMMGIPEPASPLPPPPEAAVRVKAVPKPATTRSRPRRQPTPEKFSSPRTPVPAREQAADGPGPRGRLPLYSTDPLRQGIIVSEILGPPLGLRRNEPGL